MRVAVILDTGPWYLNAFRLWFEYCVHYFALARHRAVFCRMPWRDRAVLFRPGRLRAALYDENCAHEQFQADASTQSKYDCILYCVLV